MFNPRPEGRQLLAAAGDVGQTLGDGFDCGGYRDEWMLRDSCCEGLLDGAGAGIWRMGMSYAVETRTERASEASPRFKASRWIRVVTGSRLLHHC